MVLHAALFWFALASVWLTVHDPRLQCIVALGTLAFVSPILDPLGEIGYGWVARHRHEILPGESCELE
jgi:hypothetical protein